MSLPFIALLGGSFDPIHLGHLELAQIVINSIKNAEVYFIPCGQPVHRSPAQATAQQRIAMIEQAIMDHPHFHLSTYEIDRTAPSFTIDTLRYFRQQFAHHPIGFIMGMDTFLSLDTWEQWETLLDYAHLLVLPREGVTQKPSSALQSFHAKHQIADENLLHKSNNGCIMTLPVVPLLVSSTEIRKKIATHDDTSSLLPKAVYDFIKQENLYR